MDQENSFTLQYKSKDTSDNILEHNSAPIVPYKFFSSLCSFEYFTFSNLNLYPDMYWLSSL